MSDTQAGGASIFTALREWERKNGGGGGGGKGKVDSSKPGKLRLGASKGVRRFHPGHRLSGQRINNIVKVKFVQNNNDSRRHIMAHLEYIQDREREQNEPERKFYGRDGERTREDVANTMLRNRGDKAAMFKIILSPKQNELNHIEYAKEIMRRFEEKTGIITDWALVEHRNTEHHHVHIVMPGRDMDGISYRLEKEHLDLLRELANEYQYELQDLVYEREKQIEYEFGNTREEVNLLIESSKRDRADMKELGVLDPELDRQIQKDLLPPTNWDNLYFRGQLEREMMASAAEDFKQLTPDEQVAMIAKHPDLYQGLAKQLQGQEINNQYFNRLQEVNPAEYERFVKDPSLDRTEAVEKLKQAFPDWFDPIVEKLKEEMPGLFANYEKPGPTERQIIDNLRSTSPELFPELSKQIQENQKNLFAMAYLAQNNPELYEKISQESDLGKQKQMLALAKKDFPEAMKEAELALAAQHPEIYKHGEPAPTQSQIIADLAKSKPQLFPGVAAEVQKREVDKALFEKFKELYSDAPEKFENDPAAKAMILSLLRSDRPDLLAQAEANVRDQQPGLFTIEKSEPSQSEIIQGLMKDKPLLFPAIVQEMKNREIDKAYFDRAQELMPDRLQKYADDESLSRSDLHLVLKSAFPDWRPGLEAELKEKMPQLFQYDTTKSNEQILGELQKSNPELFRGAQKSKEEPKGQDPVAAKLEEIKERLVNEAYYQRGRERLHDGLQVYLAQNEYDRQHIIEGFKESFPEWLKDIESQLKELYPVLFLKDDFAAGDQTKLEQKDLLEKLRYTQRERAADDKASVVSEAGLLLALSSGADKLEKQIDQQEKSEHDLSKEAELEEKAQHAQQDADKFQIGHGWAGLTGIHHGGFIGEKIDLQGEAKALFEDQKELEQKMNEANEHAQLIDPKVFQLEDIAKTVEERIEEHEKEKEPDERA